MLISALRVTRIGFRAAWLAGVLALLAVTALPAVLHVAGMDTYTVRGGSMAPSISLGSIVLVERVSAAAVNAGDVVTFRAPNDTIVTHRVLGRSADSDPTFITQGDANGAPDPDFVPSAAIIGRVVFSVPMVGAVLATLSTTAGMVVVVGLLISLVLCGWFIDEVRSSLIAATTRRTATELAS